MTNKLQLPRLKILLTMLLLITGDRALGGSTLPISRYEIQVSASSELSPSKNRSITYKAVNTIDGDQTTAWSEAAPGPGIGESLTYRLDNPMRINRIDIVNGYAKSAKSFRENARIKDAQIVTDVRTVNVTLPDTSQVHTLEGDFGTTTKVILKVLSVYPGSRFDDLVVTELTLWGLPAGSVTVDSSKSSSPLQRRSLPPKTVAAQLEVFVGAGPGEACLAKHTGASKVVADPGFKTEAGLFTSLCFLGFDTVRPVDVEVRAPNDVVERTQVKPLYSEFQRGLLHHWIWAARPGAPVGVYSVMARQGKQAASAKLTVRRASAPRLGVLPLDRESAMDYPPVADKGQSLDVFLAGFPPRNQVSVHLYGASKAGFASYLSTVKIPVDTNGEAIYALKTDMNTLDGVYCLGLDPRFIQSYYRGFYSDPEYPPDAQSVCLGTMFGVGKAYFGG